MSLTPRPSAPNLFWRIIISAVGLCLVAIALGSLSVYFFGQTASADIAVRRVGGASDNMRPDKRYEWSLDYSFIDTKGVVRNGTTTRRGSDMSVKTDSHVYYLPFAPFINFLESDAQPNISQPLYIIIGIFLIYIINHKVGKSKRK